MKIAICFLAFVAVSLGNPLDQQKRLYFPFLFGRDQQKRLYFPFLFGRDQQKRLYFPFLFGRDQQKRGIVPDNGDWSTNDEVDSDPDTVAMGNPLDQQKRLYFPFLFGRDQQKRLYFPFLFGRDQQKRLYFPFLFGRDQQKRGIVPDNGDWSTNDEVDSDPDTVAMGNPLDQQKRLYFPFLFGRDQQKRLYFPFLFGRGMVPDNGDWRTNDEVNSVPDSVAMELLTTGSGPELGYTRRTNWFRLIIFLMREEETEEGEKGGKDYLGALPDWRRPELGLYDCLIVELRNEDQRAFQNFMRMPPAMHDEIVQRLTPALTKETSNCSGSKYREMQYAWRVPHNTICLVVREVCEAIVHEYPFSIGYETINLK